MYVIKKYKELFSMMEKSLTCQHFSLMISRT